MCQFDDVIMCNAEPVMTLLISKSLHPLTGECNNPEFYNLRGDWQKRYESLCKSKPNQAAKVIRVPSIRYLEPLMRRGVKIIQMIRDPRGTFQSRLRLEPVGDRADNIRSYCTSLVDDVYHIKRLYKKYGNDVYKSIFYARYEDMTSRPIRYLFDLYHFLGLKPDRNVLRWVEGLQRHIVGNLNKASVEFTLRRSTSTHRENPAHTAHAWRDSMDNVWLKRVQRICGGFMKEFRYISFDSIADARNFNLASLNPWGGIIKQIYD